MAKDNKRVAMTKKMLKNSIIELLENKSIQNITVTEICSNAEVNRSTFYTYYSSPYDLMASIKKDIIADTYALTEGFQNLPSKKRLEVLLTKHLEYLTAHIKEFMAFSSDVGEDFSLPAETMEIILTPYLDAAFKNEQNEEQKKYIKTFCIFGTIGIVKRCINYNEMISGKDLSRNIIELIDDIAKIR